MDKFDAKARVEYLVSELNRHTELYDKGIPEISDKEWDDMYFELVALEHEQGYILPNSPTQSVNYTVVNELQKVEHNHPMLSLDKTKNIEEIKAFVGDKDWIAMLKMDGLTCSLLYENGRLVRAETRGDGEIGEDVTHNAMVIPSIPKRIPYTDRLIVDGEIICKLNDFKEFEDEYKNARNFASGSIRLLDSNECAKRKLTFVAWDAIGSYEKCNTLFSKLIMLMNLNFTTVPFCTAVVSEIKNATDLLKEYVKVYSYPIDGLVFKWNDCAEYESVGNTGHHFRGGLAYKFYDELYETKLIDVEWTMGKTGTLTPTAIFETVQIDGCDISRASLHNISIIKKLGLTNNCTVKISKRNEIIPQVEECLQDGDSPIKIPKYCPVCGGETEVVKENESEVLMCKNSNCSGKLLGRLKFFVSKPAMNIDGLSEATLEFLIDKGWVKSFKDLYDLNYGPWVYEWKHTNGYGEKSVNKILDAIEKSRDVKLENFICALSIDGIGKSAAKTISDKFNGDYIEFSHAYEDYFDWTELDDFGEITAKNLESYLQKYYKDVNELASEMHFVKRETKVVFTNPFNGRTLCVTGKLNHFTRDSINAKIAELGAKATGSVSKNTDYLITNEASGSSKYKKAVELHVPIITEEEFLTMIGE
jgi:DNA ligase (NAD+)